MSVNFYKLMRRLQWGTHLGLAGGKRVKNKLTDILLMNTLIVPHPELLDRATSLQIEQREPAARGRCDTNSNTRNSPAPGATVRETVRGRDGASEMCDSFCLLRQGDLHTRFCRENQDDTIVEAVEMGSTSAG